MSKVEEISRGRCSVCGQPATEDWQKNMARARLQRRQPRLQRRGNRARPAEHAGRAAGP